MKEGLSLKFATLMFKTWVDRAGMAAVSTALKKAQLEAKLVVWNWDTHTQTHANAFMHSLHAHTHTHTP